MYPLFVYLLFILMCTKTKSLSPDCRCYLFDSRIHRNGTFKSPNYNMMYETGEQCECIVYTFKAQPDEIVHIAFTNFRLSRDLYPTLQSAKFKYHLDYNQLEKVECSEYVRIFDNLETNELGNDDMYSYELCGNLDEISQHHYISKKNILMMEACLSSSDSGNFKSNGFTGKYTFEPKNRYTNDGQHVMGTNCDRLMKSPFYEENSSPSMIDRPSQSKSGHLFSPKYPQNYPPNMMCRFYLIGQPYERVILNLKDVQLQSHKNKNNTLPPKGDYLEISEAEKITLISKNTGNTHSSIFSLASIPNSLYHSNNMPILQPIQIIQYVHGKSTNDVQIISKGSNMLITFISNNDGKQSRGFEATYRFVHRNQVKPTIKNHHDSVKINQSPTNRGLSTNHHPNGNTRGTMDPVPPDIVLPAPSIPQQETIQWDRDLAEGTIFSPDYPKVYPPNQLKEYILVAPPTGKVNITLKKFKLDAEKTLSCRTHSGDRLEIYSNLNRTTNPWIVLCGTRIPLKYKFIESLNEFLILRFISDGITSSTEQGFQLNYKFLSGNGYVTTSNPVTTKATNNNISSLFNYRNHQESVQLESNLMDDQRYELFQNFKSIVDYVTNSDNSRQSSDNYQNYRQLVGSKLKKPMNAVSKEATLNRQKKKCSFIIEANYEKRSTAFQNLNFKNTLLQYSKSFYGKNEQFSSLLCKWMLIGAHYQRVQLRFVPNTPVVTDNDDDDDNWRKKKKRKHYDDTQNSSIYPNATMIQSLQMKLNNNDSDAVSGKLYNRPKIRCDTPYLLKILNYRLQSTSVDPPTYYNPNNYININSGNYNNKEQFTDQLRSNPSITTEQQVAICLGSTLDIDLSRAVYMSGNVPRMNILLYRINQYHQSTTISTYSKSSSSSPSSSSLSPSSTSYLESLPMNNEQLFIPYDIEYRFLYDYGVTTTHGKQNPPDCNFSFYSSVAKSGIFTSPNYPGLYPIDIICEYQLIGNSYEIIDLEFHEFDVESNSVRCSTDGDSDYVELRSCSTLSSILDLGKKYYCQNIEHDNNDNNKTIHVNWRKSCLIIKFFSNSMIVRHGFLAAYKFLLSESSHLRKDKTSSLLQILLVTLIHTYVHRTFEVNQYIMMV